MRVHPKRAGITEAELRACVRRYLEADVPGRLFEEFGVERGAARIDFAVAGSDLHGYELKSDFDSTGRLVNQIHAYNRVFDRITIVTGPRMVDFAADVLPRWWGITVASRRGDTLILDSLREANLNPSQDAFSVLSLLWSTEAEHILAELNVRTKRLSRYRLYELLADALAMHEVRDHVRRALLNRELTPGLT